MKVGWSGNDYLILFSGAEIAAATERYALASELPGYQVAGLRGWDDFILRDARGTTYCAPTVPLSQEYLSPFALPQEPTLSPDSRFIGKIKWYVKPVVFGGDAKSEENLIWVNHEQHGQLVRWWNEQYRSIKRGTSS
jgi:hypothetical protein